jgi:hypothetical protein
MTGDADMVPAVRAAFDICPAPTRAGLMLLHGMILASAAELPAIGRVDVGLRWGQPAYLTPETGAACSLRIGPVPGEAFGLFVHCQTGLIGAFLDGPGVGMRGQGNRAVVFRAAEEVPKVLGVLIGQALTYHLARKGRLGGGGHRTAG